MAGIAKGLSLWLSSSREAPFSKSVSSIVRGSNTGFFEPHITLVTLPNATENDVENVITKAKKIASDFKPFDVQNNGVKTGTSFWQSVLVEIKKDEALSKINARAQADFEDLRDKSMSNYYPHLSLFYGDHTPEKVASITKLFDSEKLASLPLRLDRIDIYHTEGEFKDWIHLGSAPLGDSVFFRSAQFINNRWRAPAKREYLPVVNPATREVIHYFPRGTEEDINAAVQAANDAFASWSKTDGASRSKYLTAIAAKIRERSDELVRIEVMDNGKAISEAVNDIADTAGCFDYYADQAIQLDARQDQKVELPDASYSCKLRFEPVGVAGLIIPWNYPMMMAAWKIAPCLAAGCTAVLKPSELTPLTALELAGICKEVGLPAGVVNVVTGLGKEAGQPLSAHPQVEKLAFTGSVPTGSQVMTTGGHTIKNVSLELGGKSPFIIFDDANVDQAVEWAMFGIFANQGQVCSATSRVLVQENFYEKFLDRLVSETKKVKIGNGLESDTRLGPIVSEGQYNKILDFLKKGQDEGAKMEYGGQENSLPGFFVRPTIFTNVDLKSKIWNEEIFGPVVCVNKFKSEDEAVQQANDSDYGLAAAVMSKDKERCQRVSKALRAGIVWINCSQPTFVQAPWGGMKKSGTGRELGPWGMENYLEVKQVTEYNDQDGLGFQWYIKK